MKRNVVVISLVVAALCGWMFYNRYLTFVLSGAEAAYPERTGWMWGSLGLVALVMAVVAARSRP